MCLDGATFNHSDSNSVETTRLSMTSRTLLILMMLAQALACPYLDCGECRGVCAAAQCAVEIACDNCCKSESSVCEYEPDSCDDPACPDNPGPLDCLCGGAVQVDGVDCPDLLAGGEFPALPEVARAHSTLLVSATSSELAIIGCPHFPPLISGTSLCALTQTYLL